MDKEIIKTGIEVILKANEDIDFKSFNQTFSDMNMTHEAIGDIMCSLFLYLYSCDVSIYDKITPNDILEFINNKINK